MTGVSVVIPARNAETFIGEAIQSVFDQKMDDVEIIVVDDGSTDGTATVADRYGDRLRVLPGRKRGPGAARNVGIEAARRDYVALLDADDVWLPGKLQKQIAAMAARPEAALCYTGYWCVDEYGNSLAKQHALKFPEGRILRRLLVENCIGTSTVMLRRRVLGSTLRFLEGVEWEEDYHLWVRLAVSHPFCAVPERLTRFRFHRGSLTAQMDRQELADINEKIVADLKFHLPPGPYAPLLEWSCRIRNGRRLLKEDRLREARSQFERALAARPFTPRAWLYGLRTYLGRGTNRLLNQLAEADRKRRSRSVVADFPPP